MEKEKLDQIKKTVEEFFEKMTMQVSVIEVVCENSGKTENIETEEKKVINISIKAEEPQILIGQGGQTLFELQRILKTILIKKTNEIFYLNLDINEYKNKKIEYLKDTAKNIADEVSLSKKEKVLNPMSAYERRIIHAELSNRGDVTTESQGEGQNRSIVIKPK
jgi:spoIIIJ-associated protein